MVTTSFGGTSATLAAHQPTPIRNGEEPFFQTRNAAVPPPVPPRIALAPAVQVARVLQAPSLRSTRRFTNKPDDVT